MKKGVVISISVLLILLVLACSLIGYGDLLPGKPVPWDTVTMDSTETVYFGGNFIRANGLGTVVVAKNNLTYPDQRIVAWKGVFLDRITTHLTMLSLREGMSLPQVIAAAGMPDGTTGSGIVRLAFNTLDGYTYAIEFVDKSDNGDQTDPVLSGISVFSPVSGWLYPEEVSLFLWKMQLFYIVAAALLGGALTGLLKLSKLIEKRKAEMP